jgi:cytochrome b561/polyisoprenoid-binding protein YceI
MTASSSPPRVSGDRYSVVAIVLHWLIAAAIVVQVMLAGRMEGPPTPESFAVTQLHKSIGISILLLSLVRLAWRLMNPPAPLPDSMARWQRILARATHVGLYVVMIGMPLTGWVMVSASRFAIPTLLYGAVPWPDLPIVHLAPAAKKLWRTVGVVGHGGLAKVLYVLAALHVAGALQHQLFSRDESIFAWMAPGAKAGRWLEPRLLLIAAAFVGVVAFGKFVEPPKPAAGPPPPVAAAPEPVAPPQATSSAPAATPGQTPAATPTPTATPTPGVQAPPAGQPVHWRVAAGSSLSFTTTWGGQPVEGRFDRWRADIRFSPEALERSRLKVTIDLASVATGDAQRDQSLPSADWFNVAEAPQAVFTANRFEKTAEGRYIAHGELQLRGVTHPLDLPFQLRIDGDTAHARSQTSLDRLAFGVGQGEWAKTDQIPARVGIRILVNASRD